jgi:RimJ/RimL family protein N-acetyltransferase
VTEYFPAYRRGEFGSPRRRADAIGAGGPVHLRPLDAGDLERTHRWHNDAALYDSLVGDYRPVSLETERRWLERVSAPADDQVNLAICLETDEHIGNIYLRDVDRAAGTAELHVFIAAPRHRSRGYGRQAVSRLLEHAFTTLGLAQVRLHVLYKNASAIRCYEQCGFRVARVLRGHVVKDGRSQDVVMMIRDAPGASDAAVHA